jgi:DNA-binding PadR family transcriptional regulator
MNIPKDLVAASATPLILSILGSGESYGYDIIRRVREMSDGEVEWTDGMLYPILHRLEKKGLIESHWGKSESGRKRKYYQLCPSGAKELETQRNQWNLISGMLQKLQEGEICLT